MIVSFWGVRGSYPAPGPGTNRFGGNTACVSVRTDAGTTLIIDAGTGIRRLGRHLQASGQAGRVHLLISHTHWDHLQGLPFFAPLYTAGNRLDLYARQRNVHIKTIVSDSTRAPYFPVAMDEVAAEVHYHEVVEGARLELGDATVRCVRLNHPYIALGYRIEADGGSVTYMADTAPFDRMVLGYDYIPKSDPLHVPSAAELEHLSEIRRAALEACRGADLVIYDTMFEPEEYLQYPHWGHSTPEDALELVQEAGAHCLALFHHHPARTDAQQLAIERRARDKSARALVIASFEGLQLSCSGGGARRVG